MTYEERIQFEIQRRGVVFTTNTTLVSEDGSPDGPELGYDGDPNNANTGINDGQELIYMSPLFTTFGQSNGTNWIKTEMPNTWRKFDEFDSVTIKTETKAPLSIKPAAKDFMVENLNVEYLGGKKESDLVPRNFLSISNQRIYTKSKPTPVKDDSYLFIYNDGNVEGQTSGTEKITLSKIHRPSTYIYELDDIGEEILIDDFVYHKLS